MLYIMGNKSKNNISTKEALNKLKLEAAQGVGIPFEGRPNENVIPSQNASVTVTTKKHFK